MSALVHETRPLSDCPQCLQGAPPHAAGDATGRAAPKKVVYGKKKAAKKEAAPTDAASRAAEEEADALAEREATEEAAKQAQASFLLHAPCLGTCQRGTAVALKGTCCLQRLACDPEASDQHQGVSGAEQCPKSSGG